LERNNRSGREKLDKAIDLANVADDLGYRVFEYATKKAARSFPKDTLIGSMHEVINEHGRILITEIEKKFDNLVTDLSKYND
jgi:hypothetical protein